LYPSDGSELDTASQFKQLTSLKFACIFSKKLIPYIFSSKESSIASNNVKVGIIPLICFSQDSIEKEDFVSLLILNEGNKMIPLNGATLSMSFISGRFLESIIDVGTRIIVDNNQWKYLSEAAQPLLLEVLTIAK
jgi:hypothetical protein